MHVQWRVGCGESTDVGGVSEWPISDYNNVLQAHMFVSLCACVCVCPLLRRQFEY